MAHEMELHHSDRIEWYSMRVSMFPRIDIRIDQPEWSN